MKKNKAYKRLEKLNINYSKLVHCSHEYIDEFCSYINSMGLSSFKVDNSKSLRIDFSMMGTDFYFEFEFIIPDLEFCNINHHISSNNEFLFNIKMDGKGNIYSVDTEKVTLNNIETCFSKILDRVYSAFCLQVLESTDSK
jgi:hypothetical protein